MVRGNWQKRVETADARRKEAKQRKQKSEEKRVFKTMAQEALSMLDRHVDSIRRRSSTTLKQPHSPPSSWKLHIWTDTCPSKSPPLLDMIVPDEAIRIGLSRKGRTSSVDEKFDHETGGGSKGGKKKGRGRSGSFQQEGGKSHKKVHPRSREADVALVHDSKPHAPMLCRSQFFSGKCMEINKGGKKGWCPCVHYNNKQCKTLSDILSPLRKKHEQDAQRITKQQQKQPPLTLAEEAYASSVDLDASEPVQKTMQMVYYLSIPIPNDIGEVSQNNAATSAEKLAPNKSSTAMSDLITEELNDNGCSISGIVYLVMSSPERNVLIYDRFREGLTVADFSADVMGLAGLEGTTDDDEISSDKAHAQDLPVAILEHILTFVEAPAVAAASQVCVAWHQEIRHASPKLWQHLLDQRSWPPPYDLSDIRDDDPANDTAAKDLRDEFIKHYLVLRDIRAIKAALSGMLSKKLYLEGEMAYQTFSARRGSPQPPNRVIGVEIWSPNQVLAAYSNDCTLRLFQAVPRGGSPQDKVCRELVCQSIDPYLHTKKTNCFIESMCLDEDVVGCLCSIVHEKDNAKSPHILVVLGREDLLVANDAKGQISEPEEGALQIIDIEEAILNYVLSLDQVDPNLLRLNDFVALGGDTDEIEFIVSQSMVACGHGRFMIEVAISIPPPDNDGEELQDLGGDMLLLDRKLFLFSTTVRAIVWMGHSNPPNQPLRPRSEDITLISLQERLQDSATSYTNTVAAASNLVAPRINCCSVDHRGNVANQRIMGLSEWEVRQRSTEEGWSPLIDGPRAMVVTTTDILVGDTLTRVPEGNNDDGDKEYKTIVAFYSRSPVTEEATDRMVQLDMGDNCLIDQMVAFRDDYVLLICRFFTKTGFAAADGGGGHWGAEIDRPATVYALVIHVRSRSVIEKVCLYEDVGFNRLTVSVDGDTVACAAWIKGLIMTGSDVRSVNMVSTCEGTVATNDDFTGKTPKKKGKKRQSKGSGKKDGFARGMSLRG